MTEDVRLVAFTAAHAPVTLVWMNDPEYMRLLNREHTITDAEHARWVAGLGARDDVRYFAVEDAAGRHLGNVWLANIDRRHRKAELRVLIGCREAHGRGVGARALALAADAGFGLLQLHRVYAYVLASNTRAIRAFESAGFVREGRLRDDRRSGSGWQDALLLARVADSAEST